MSGCSIQCTIVLIVFSLYLIVCSFLVHLVIVTLTITQRRARNLSLMNYLLYYFSGGVLLIVRVMIFRLDWLMLFDFPSYAVHYY